jgi:uncharacterized protein YndB with AHSA1/START domain
MAKTNITVKTTINALVSKVWEFYNSPKHIVNWNNASPDWHTTRAESDLRVGGKFVSRMEAKDGSIGFDFGGVYTAVKPNELLSYTIGDGRKASITFAESKGKTDVSVTFEAENENPIEMQRGGWQAILDNFKKYVESH